MKQLITGVETGSVAEKYGLSPGDAIITIDGEPVIDEIDYQALSAQRELTLFIEQPDGKTTSILITKEDWVPLGLRFDENMTLSARTCCNKCLFCFIDQMRPGMRDTLYVKDDDWRFSLMMGNFVTLTNVSEQEFERIIKRHASPLYVSVHTTDPQLRCQMLSNRFAGDIMNRLTRLKDAGIRFHCQIVCCPGYNDGEELLKTLYDLRSLAPAAISVAVVPVGLTRYRQGLTDIKLFDQDMATKLLQMIIPFQEECRKALGTTFLFPSDEFYCLSGEPIPTKSWYEDFPQIENGVGLLAQLEDGMHEAAMDESDNPEAQHAKRTYVMVTGVSAAPHLKRLAEQFAPPETEVRIATIINHFFGETITVTGLLTGGDVLEQLTPEMLSGADAVLISHNMLRHERDLFLDDMTFEEFTRRLPVPVRVVEDGYDLYEAIHGRTTAE